MEASLTTPGQNTPPEGKSCVPIKRTWRASQRRYEYAPPSIGKNQPHSCLYGRLGRWTELLTTCPETSFTSLQSKQFSVRNINGGVTTGQSFRHRSAGVGLPALRRLTRMMLMLRTFALNTMGRFGRVVHSKDTGAITRQITAILAVNGVRRASVFRSLLCAVSVVFKPGRRRGDGKEKERKVLSAQKNRSDYRIGRSHPDCRRWPMLTFGTVWDLATLEHWMRTDKHPGRRNELFYQEQTDLRRSAHGEFTKLLSTHH